MNCSASATSATAPPTTATASLLSRYAQIFVARRDRYLAVGKDSGWYSKKKRLTDRAIERALRGDTHLGLYSVSEKGLSKWCVWDADSDEDTRTLLNAAHLLPAESVVVERSRRGLHLFRLFDPPVPWRAAQRYGIAFAHRAGADFVEVFPKNGTYSGVRAPITKHNKTGLVYPWFDPATGEEIDPWATLPTLRPTPIPDQWLEEPEEEAPTPVLTRALPFGQLPALDEHAALVELASRYTTLRPTGKRRLSGKCPFHRDDHASFGIDDQWFECFAKCLGAGQSRGGINLFRKILRERGME
jgi:hypothetical protein